MNAHVRVFRALLRLYPTDFRDVYGGEMTRFFLERLERANATRRPLAVARLWSRTAADIVKTAAAERVSRARGDHPTNEPMSSFLHDLRYAGRRLRKTPVFTLSAIAILALGIGLNATVFSLVDATLYRPPPFEKPDEIVHIYQHSDEGSPSSTAFPAYLDIAATTGVFAGVSATSSDNARWDRTEGPHTVAIEFTTASYFPMLGLAPSRGRWFAREHDRVGAEMVAVVSHRTWRTQMGADANVLGSSIRLNNQLVTIIGVGPEKFNGEAGALVTDFWLSISSTPVGGEYRVINLDRREDHWYQVKARLAPGVTVERAQAAMTALARDMGETYPALDRGRGITVYGYDDVRFHPQADQALFAANIGLFVAAGLILLIACSNLANLLLVRGISRRPEMALREALGAGKSRVVRLFLLEALLLAALGGAAGLAAATWAVKLVPSLPIPTPGGTLDISFDHRVAIFGVLLTLATGLIFGLLPALRTAPTDVARALRDEGRGRSAGRNISFLRGGLVVVQVAVSLVLVVGAGLLARSLANAERVDPGVDADKIAVLGTNLSQGGFTGPAAGAVVTEIIERLGTLPGVERVALTTRLPAQPGGTTTQTVEGYVPPAGTGSVELPYAAVSRGYFETMGIPLIAGRTFSADDRPESQRMIVVNETAARVFWGESSDALRGRVRAQGSQDESAWRQVVGVVGDVKVASLREPPTPMMYYSADQTGVSSFALVVRTTGDPSGIIGGLRTKLREVRPTLPVTRLLTLESHFGAGLAEARAAAALMGAFSVLALLLASLGVYAVVSFSVERRTQEIGIRVALGAPRAQIVRTVVGDSLVAVGVGLGVGLLVAGLATRGMQGMLFAVGALDQVTFAGAALLLIVSAGIAAFLPALRATRADPAEVLRSQ
ncbi:MAG: ADOP family duplicated permease [Gemmatimonadaceae bacterium]